MSTAQGTKKPNVLICLGWNDPVALKAIGKYARQAGWHIESRLIYTEEIPTGWKGDGMIVSSSQRADMRRFLRRQAPRQHTVICGSNDMDLPGTPVAEDNLAAGQLVARHFLERNHRNFAWFTAYYGKTAIRRRDGYISELSKAGHTCTRLEYAPSPQANSGRRQRRQWLARRLSNLPRPIALFALDDTLASEAISVCIENGWRVPEDISIAGVGNLEFAREFSLVPLTSVDLGAEEIAWRAAQVLDELMHGKKYVGPIILPPREIIIRQSSDTLAAGNPSLQAAIRFMKENFSKPILTDSIAEAAGISRQELYFLFRDELKRTPAKQLQLFRLEQAQRMLTSTRDACEKIALACGFGTKRTFDRCFLRANKMPASAWRAKNRVDPGVVTPFSAE